MISPRFSRALFALALFGAAAASSPARAQGPAGAPALLAGARSAREASRFAECESLATVARDRLAAAPRVDTLAFAQALWEIAESRYQRRLTGDTTGVASGLRSARLFEATGRRGVLGAALAHQTVGDFYAITRQSAEALVQQRAALAIHRREAGEQNALTAGSFYRIGTLYSQLDEPDSAIAALDTALAIRRALKQPRDRAIGDILAYQGYALEMKGEDDRARAVLAEAIRAAEEQLGPTDIGLMRPLNLAASFAYRHGEYPAVLDDLERTIAIMSVRMAADDPDLLVTRGNLASVYLQIGDARRARRIYQEVLAAMVPKQGEGNASVVTFRIALANANRELGDTLASLQQMAEIRRLFEHDTTRTDRARYATVLFNEGDLLDECGDHAGAIDRATRCAALVRAGATTDRKLLIRSLLLLEGANAQQGRWAEVDQVDAEVEKVLAVANPRDPRLESFAGIFRSDAEMLRGRNDRALVLAANAARIEREALMSEAKSLSDAQAIQLASTLSRPLDMLLRAGALSGDGAAVKTSWDELARWRGLVRHVIAERRAPPGADAEPRLREAHDAWRHAEEALARFEVEQAGVARDSARSAESARLHAQVDDAERRLARDFPAVTPALDPARVTLEAVLAALPEDAALVAFAQAPQTRADDHLVAFVGTRSGTVRSLDLGPVAAVTDRVATWRASLSETREDRRSDAGTRRAGEELRRIVWDPVVKLTGDAKTVMIVPEAPLLGLPWGALPSGKGYLVEDGPLVRVLDAERDLLLGGSGGHGAGLLAVGGVDFDRARPPAGEAAPLAAAVTRAPSCGTGARFAALPGTAAEVDAIASEWSGGRTPGPGASTVLQGDLATETEFKARAGGRDVIHLATHGVALDDTCGRGPVGTRGVGGVSEIAKPVGRPRAKPGAPVNTVSVPEAAPTPWSARQVLLAFANANHSRTPVAGGDDGLLTVQEVQTLNLKGTDWVVLSACRSAEGEAWTREGVVGMQRAFRLAGARTVIASQWSVADDATREWMQALYHARAGGLTGAAEAMTAASREVLARRRATARSTHPFYWAAFTASGE